MDTMFLAFMPMVIMMIVATAISIPVLKYYAKRKAEKEALRLKLKEERETQRLMQERAKSELELEMQRAQANLQIEKEKSTLSACCTYCGSKHEIGAKHCSNCGASLK